MTVVPGSIQSHIMVTSVSTVLSGTGKRNNSPDSRSTPPNTKRPSTGSPLWYYRRTNLLSSISTVLLGPPILTKQPSRNTSIVSLQNMPQSATVCVQRHTSIVSLQNMPQSATVCVQRHTSIVSLQNMPQSATVCVQRQYSLWIQVACSRRTMSYVMSRISWRVRLLCWNHDTCLMDANWLHLTPATLLWHR